MGLLDAEVTSATRSSVVSVNRTARSYYGTVRQPAASEAATGAFALGGVAPGAISDWLRASMVGRKADAGQSLARGRVSAKLHKVRSEPWARGNHSGTKRLLRMELGDEFPFG